MVVLLAEDTDTHKKRWLAGWGGRYRVTGMVNEVGIRMTDYICECWLWLIVFSKDVVGGK